MEIDDVTTLYFFSTYSQAVAALVGLSATFAIFHYQNIRASFSHKVERIYASFNNHFRQFMTEDQQKKFDDFINHEQRATFIEPIYRSWITTGRAAQIATQLDHPVKVHEFEMWADEFNDYVAIKKRILVFRHRFLIATMLGLFSVTLGLAGIGIVDVDALRADRVFVLVTAVSVLIIYLVLLYRILSQSFQKPE